MEEEAVEKEKREGSDGEELDRKGVSKGARGRL